MGCIGLKIGGYRNLGDKPFFKVDQSNTTGFKKGIIVWKKKETRPLVRGATLDSSRSPPSCISETVREVALSGFKYLWRVSEGENRSELVTYIKPCCKTPV